MLLLDSTADTARPLLPANQEKIATTMCTSAAIMETAVRLGIGIAAPMARVPVVNMLSSLPQTIDGDLVNEEGGLFFCVDELGGEDVVLYF